MPFIIINQDEYSTAFTRVRKRIRGNRRLAIGATISFVHASIVLFLLFEDMLEWQFLVYATIPALITIIIPFLITETLIKRRCREESVESYLRTLSETTGESTPAATEVEMNSNLLEQLPEEVADPDSVKVVEEDLLDHVDGEEFDPVDADTRGVVAMGFASVLVVPSALIVGILMGGIMPLILGLVVSVFAAWIVLQQYRDMVAVIEYTPQTIDS